MKFLRARCAVLLVPLFAALLSSRYGAAQGLSGEGLGLHIKACAVTTNGIPAKCGTFGVYEDRAARSGRIIDLHFVLLKARHPSGHAVYWNPGGPGASTLAFLPEIVDGKTARELLALRNRYDILLLDNRGVGASHSLNCDLYSSAYPQAYFSQLWPSKALEACRTKRSSEGNPSDYTTNYAVDDLDDLRVALGYSKLVLDGDSYGTFFSFVYIRRHSAYVESALLDGVAPPYFLLVPLEDASAAQKSIDNLIIACRLDHTCHSYFPDFGAHFAAVARRFDHGAVAVRFVEDGHSRTLLLSKEVFADRLRQTLYQPDTAAYVPYIIERAFQRDYQPLATLIRVITLGFSQTVEMATNLSYTCAEDIPFITEQAITHTSAHSFVGDSRVRAQQRACSIWSVTPVDASFQLPVRTTLPLLMISGTDDPVSPPNFARDELAYAPNAKLVLVRGAGHTTETGCTDHLKVMFVDSRGRKGLNVSCSNAFERPPFATSLKGFVKDAE